MKAVLKKEADGLMRRRLRAPVKEHWELSRDLVLEHLEVTELLSRAVKLVAAAGALKKD